jgi:hypothetical protein
MLSCLRKKEEEDMPRIAIVGNNSTLSRIGVVVSIRV